MQSGLLWEPLLEAVHHLEQQQRFLSQGGRQTVHPLLGGTDCGSLTPYTHPPETNSHHI